MSINFEILRRMRRNRTNASIRRLVRETQLQISDLVMPLFVLPPGKASEKIPSMPGISRLSQEDLLHECEALLNLKILAVALFPVVEEIKKDKQATESYQKDNFYVETIRKIKQKFPELLIITDVAMDPYSSDGHDGIVNEKGIILNDETLEILAQMSLVQAEAGADIIAPSDMMDGRVEFIRKHLDHKGFKDTAILSYTAKYASAFYGPFRDALDSAPKFGDKKTYQMDPANVREAHLEATLDYEEGADIIMVKPGLPYLDVIRSLSEDSLLPVAAYNVSGEYAMIKAACQNGWLEYAKAMLEILLSFKRAGADIILTYHAKDAAEILSQKQ